MASVMPRVRAGGEHEPSALKPSRDLGRLGGMGPAMELVCCDESESQAGDRNEEEPSGETSTSRNKEE